ncbi:PRTRC system ThiF family protein [Dyadobacter frigoris]|uniref:PRTRC system ThiF family protein n=1 Tax=Dyadobacter frigoris TaxID=2576211 RepID=A0A4U6CN33_9BACT|nr:PRTRC system ThiF family protein [Dyadobacter frigoris]TKT85476.1 PRTRC system ThiF family protein [Dyadobacter frigoris]GLU56247.1 thiazole biosynthesis adenylyltransferase ThiF [Dyadobacter frigoris]
MNTQTAVHFTDNYLINPSHPLTVNLIGAGGTGSQMLTALARINHSLIALNHAGLQVAVFDDDIITEANLGRQLFAGSELGLNKAVALTNRISRFFGSNWKAVPRRFDYSLSDPLKGANIYISCVDTASARFGIAKVLKFVAEQNRYNRDKPLYWIDCGNSQNTGQVILSTISQIKQPVSKVYKTVSELPMITEEYSQLLTKSEKEDNTPSCSLAEALEKQDLFINSTLANMAASLLWNLFRQGFTENRGFFMNLKDFKCTPVKV